MLKSERQKDGARRDHQNPNPPLYQEPVPPAGPPNRVRRSAAGRQRTTRANSLPTGATPSPQTSRTVSPSSPPPNQTQRPLSRYRILPSISGDAEEPTRRNTRSRPRSNPEPPASTPLCLALRLPDGRRVQSTFRSGDALDAVLAFAVEEMKAERKKRTADAAGEASAEPPLSMKKARSLYELMASGERRVLHDWQASLHELGVCDRSLYIMQERE